MRSALPAVVLLLGCGQWAMPPITTTTVTSASVSPTLSDERAIHDIAEARCTRRMSCDETVRSCPATDETVTRAYLLGADCSDGVPAARLSRCLSDVADQLCDDARDQEPVASCRNDELCR